MTTRVRRPWGRQGRGQQFAIQRENWKTKPSWEPQQFLQGTRRSLKHGTRQQSTVRSRGARKAYSLTGTVPKQLSPSLTERARHIRPGERKRSPDANPSDDLSTRKRRLESQDQD